MKDQRVPPKAKPLRVAANDPSGSHAVVGGALTMLRGEQLAAYRRAKRMPPAAGYRYLMKQLGALVIAAKFDAVAGSRAERRSKKPSAEIIFMVSGDDRLALMHLRMHVGRWLPPYLFGLELERHALARALARTVHEADINTIASAVNNHVAALVAWLLPRISGSEDVFDGMSLHALNAQGGLLCQVVVDEIGPQIVAKTWIDASQYRADQRKEVEPGHVTVYVPPLTPEERTAAEAAVAQAVTELGSAITTARQEVKNAKSKFSN